MAERVWVYLFLFGALQPSDRCHSSRAVHCSFSCAAPFCPLRASASASLHFFILASIAFLFLSSSKEQKGTALRALSLVLFHVAESFFKKPLRRQTRHSPTCRTSLNVPRFQKCLSLTFRQTFDWVKVKAIARGRPPLRQSAQFRPRFCYAAFIREKSLCSCFLSLSLCILSKQ